MCSTPCWRRQATTPVAPLQSFDVFILLLFVAKLIGDMSVTVFGLPLYVYYCRYYAMLLLCHAILVYVIAIPCLNHAMFMLD